MAKLELERCLVPAGGKHMRWCLNKLSVLPSKDGQELVFALFAENFLDVCREYPDDLWTAGTLELLKTKTFRPSPAEFVAAVGSRLAERRRMLERVQRLLAGDVKKPDAPFVVEPLDVRLRTLRDGLKRIGRLDRAAPHERELALMEGRAVEAWAIPAEERTEVGVLVPNWEMPLPSGDVVQRARMLLLSAKFHRLDGWPEMADRFEAAARKLAPQLFEEAAP